jgi:hypothetical protein
MKGVIGCILFYGLLIGGFYLLITYGWLGAAIDFLAVAILLGGAFLLDKNKEKREERKRAIAPCIHGVPGALNAPRQCMVCWSEKEQQEQRARKQREEDEVRRKAELGRARKEWLEKIKLPEYLASMDPEKFEHLICDLFREMGYEVNGTPYVGDSGIDGYLL